MKYLVQIVLIVLFYTSLSGEPGKNRIAPNFFLKDLQGKSHFLNDYCGTKKSVFKKNEKNVVLLSFFATWCLPCKEEFPVLEKLAAHYAGKKVKIFLINIEKDRALVRKYVREQKITVPVLLDHYGIAKKNFQVQTIPHLFLIDPAQRITWEKNGFDPTLPLYDTLSAKIDSLLKAYFDNK